MISGFMTTFRDLKLSAFGTYIPWMWIFQFANYENVVRNAQDTFNHIFSNTATAFMMKVNKSSPLCLG